MKKLISIIFILILSITPIIFAEGRSMTEKEQNEFVNYINEKVIIPFTKNIKNAPYIKDLNIKIEEHNTSNENIANLIKSFEDGNDAFDRYLNINFSPFKETLEHYHKNVLSTEHLVGCPLCCRGLTSFVVKELMDRGIECRYVKLTTKNGENHDVALYKTCDTWFVCDLCKAMNLYVLQTYCKDQEIIEKATLELLGNSKKLCTELLKMPKDDYQKLFCNETSPWKEMELTEEKLNASTNTVRDHGLDLDAIQQCITQ